MRHDDQVNIPTPRFRLPVLGDVLSVDAAKPTQRELRMAAELGPIFERKILGHRLVIVSGAELVAELNDESRFAKFLALPHRKLRALGGDGLFTAFNSEPNWAAAHRILMPGFSRDAMRRYHGVMTTVAAELVEHWTARPHSFVDVTADLNKLTLENMSRAGFGYSFDSFAGEGENEFVAAIVRVLGHVNRTSNDLPFMRIFRGGDRARNERDIAYVHGVVDDVIDARIAEGDVRHDDLLDLMLHTPDPETGELLDKVNIRHQVLTFLVAGNETTAGTLAFALYFLARHPGVAERVRAEADGFRTPSFEDIPKMRYTRSVVDETLRLWPSAPGYFRKARTDTSLASGKYPMKAGDWVFVLTLALHRDPVWGPDAEHFDPDRFSPQRARTRPAQAYRPFGTGMRGCIGRQFALHESVATLAELVRTFDFELDDRYRLDIGEALTLKPRNLRMKVRTR
nr:cytochrome P450 [Rhodococcus sp. (in: high G+C Gram-positive bacteria)]